ncbi:MAG: DEAD/DEAH box helicase [Ruminococcus sp.]|nr:DEAD/DEAH box helicase [Ruminococcus sp.]MBR2284624.1 DEAD/DEAH box helicase [Ruminococcus sp.]
MRFSELNLSEELLQAVEELGYTEMTEIQQKSIPLLLRGMDVIGRSATGTGKTAAFGLPAVESITEDDRKAPAVLILCPTRELALQAAGEIRKFSSYKRIVRTAAVYGGASMEKQISELKRGANIVIGTPGRIMDHIRRRTLKLENIRTVILDEADEMLDMGFREDIEEILSHVPEERQTVLFSATMPKEILALTKKYQTDPVMVEIRSAQKTAPLIEQLCYEVPMGRKTDALRLLLAAYSTGEGFSAMVFCNTKSMVDQLTEELAKTGSGTAGLHGDMKQAQRTQVMNGFKSGRISILIATDVAARGIDVSGVDVVFNYDIPQNNEYYIHRIGRTGRAGRTGIACTLVSGRRQLRELHDIARFAGSEIKELPLPDREGIAAAKQEKIVSGVAEAEKSGNIGGIMADRLAAMGVDYREAAARLLEEKLRAETAAIPQIDIPQPLKKGRKGSRQTTRLDLDIGRDKRMAPNFILGALADATGLSGQDFGKIDIYDTHTTVEIPEEERDYILETAGTLKINGNQVRVTLWNGKPHRSGQPERSEKSDKQYGRRPDRRKKAYSGGGDYTRSRRRRIHNKH